MDRRNIEYFYHQRKFYWTCCPQQLSIAISPAWTLPNVLSIEDCKPGCSLPRSTLTLLLEQCSGSKETLAHWYPHSHFLPWKSTPHAFQPNNFSLDLTWLTTKQRIEGPFYWPPFSSDYTSTHRGSTILVFQWSLNLVALTFNFK